MHRHNVLLSQSKIRIKYKAEEGENIWEVYNLHRHVRKAKISRNIISKVAVLHLYASKKDRLAWDVVMMEDDLTVHCEETPSKPAQSSSLAGFEKLQTLGKYRSQPRIHHNLMVICIPFCLVAFFRSSLVRRRSQIAWYLLKFKYNTYSLQDFLFKLLIII